MKIGIFDSGIGGLSVLHKALSAIPDAEFIYYADTENVPYGEKSREEIEQLSENVMQFLFTRDMEAIVVACNTATSVAIKKLRAEYALPIIGMEPAIKKARDEYPEGRTLVIATPVTVMGDKMRYLLEQVDSKHLVDLIATPKLVRYAEAGVFEDEEIKEYLLGQFKGLDLGIYSALVLGCTHFNYFKTLLRSILPESVHFVDGVEGTVMQLMRKTGLDPEGVHRKRCVPTKKYMDRVSFFYSGWEALPEDLSKIECYFDKLDEVEKL